jgi:SAM-dependent methyltransferase
MAVAPVPAESEPDRVKRRQQRTLFDSIAGLYERTRPGYPDELVDFVVTTAGLGRGSAVLEIGCGTGQLTRPLARRGLGVTAIDLSPSMVEAARRRAPGATYAVTSFEDLDGPDESFALIAAGSAFHWIDPEVRFAKAARLLRPGGWLALLGVGERYDSPVGGILDRMWRARANAEGAWSAWPGDTAAFAASGLFGPPLERGSWSRATYTAEAVIGVENTRATALSWPEADRLAFTEELRAHLLDYPEIRLTLDSSATMAQVLA